MNKMNLSRLGGDLAQFINQVKNRQEKIPELIIKMWFGQLCKALKYIHAKNIIHRDVKPSNIFMDEFQNIKLGDFGSAKKLEKTIDFVQTARIHGTPNYIAPEIWKKQPYNEKVDMWGLGCTLYELLALKPPFTCNNLADLVKEVTTSVFPPAIPQHHSGNISHFIPGLLEIQPDRRLSADQIVNR